MTSTILLVTVLSQVSPKVFDNPAPWKLESTTDGIKLESRPVEDSVYFEYRATIDTDVPVANLCERVFEWGTRDTDGTAKERKVLTDGENERVVYDQIEAPMVSNRDYAMTVKRTKGEGDAPCRIRFWQTNQHAPKLKEGWVRVEKLWGSWTFSPLKNGKTRLVHTLFADPGGSVPSVFVHGAHRDTTLASVKKAIEKSRVASR